VSASAQLTAGESHTDGRSLSSVANIKRSC